MGTLIIAEEHKYHFKNHKATFTDLGNIKILDYKAPDSNEYRIRFLFEEDYYRVHISGDLGELTAWSPCSMVFEKFHQFLQDEDYFAGKVLCHSRPFTTYDTGLAKKQVLEKFSREELARAMDLDEDDAEDDYWFNSYFDDLFDDFDEERGIGQKLTDVLHEIDEYYYEYAYDFGKRNTGIISLYIMAFEMAMDDLKGNNTVSGKGETHES